jgi:hypothetical protein
MVRRSRVVLVVFGGMLLLLTANAVWSRWHALPPLEIGPPTAKPTANFVPLRPVGDVRMPLQPTNADGSAFTSSTIVTSAAHPSGVAYLAGWRRGRACRSVRWFWPPASRCSPSWISAPGNGCTSWPPDQKAS